MERDKNYFICTVTCDNADGDTDRFTWKTERWASEEVVCQTDIGSAGTRLGLRKRKAEVKRAAGRRDPNDTEQEEVDIADDQDADFAGGYFANAFKSNYDAGGIEKW